MNKIEDSTLIILKREERCEKCEHWGDSNDWLNEYNRLKKNFAECLSDKFIDTSEQKKFPPTDGVAYTDYESYAAEIYSGKDFGCIHFKIKIRGEKII